MSSYLNLSPQDLDIHVYRVIPLTRLYQLFETRTNVLVSPTGSLSTDADGLQND